MNSGKKAFILEMDVVREALRDLIQFLPKKDTENRLYRFCRSSNRISGKIHQLRWGID